MPTAHEYALSRRTYRYTHDRRIGTVETGYTVRAPSGNSASYMYIYNIIADTDLSSSGKKKLGIKAEGRTIGAAAGIARVTHDAFLLFAGGTRERLHKSVHSLFSSFAVFPAEHRLGAKRPLPPRIPFLNEHVRPVRIGRCVNYSSHSSHLVGEQTHVATDFATDRVIPRCSPLRNDVRTRFSQY